MPVFLPAVSWSVETHQRLRGPTSSGLQEDCLPGLDTGAYESDAARWAAQSWVLVSKCSPWGQGGVRNQRVGSWWDLLVSQQWNLGLGWGLEWPHVMWSGCTPSLWSLVLLVVGCVWNKDKLFLRDQPFKIHCTLSTQIFLSLRWILGALRSCFFFLSFKTMNQEVSLLSIFPFDWKKPNYYKMKAALCLFATSQKRMNFLLGEQWISQDFA